MVDTWHGGAVSVALCLVMGHATIPATLIPGDGIGPEIIAAVCEVLDALGAPFDWETAQGGMAAVQQRRPAAPATLDSIRRTRLALKGPLTTPVGGGFRSVNVRLREEFQLYANLRPARTLIPGGRYDDIDLVLVRENLEGPVRRLRALHPDRRRPARGGDRLGRQHARRVAGASPSSPSTTRCKHGRKKVTIVHKANVLKALTGLFLETARRGRQEVRRPDRARRPHRRRLRDAAGARTRGSST